MCTFWRFTGLITTHFITEASNLTTILTLTLLIIILSFVDWWRGRGVFLTCEGEILLVSRYVHFLKVYGTHYYTLHHWSLKLDHHSYFDTTNHNSKFRRLVTWSRCVPNMWGWDFTRKSICALFECFTGLITTHFIAAASNLTTILTLTLLIIILSFLDWWRSRVACVPNMWGRVRFYL